MAVAGCTILSPSSPAATTTPGGATTAPTTAATAKPSGVTLFDMGKFSWYEYKTSAAGMDMTTKTETGTASYGGVSNARRLKSTMTTGTGEQAMVTESDMYFNPTTNALLGGHTKATMGGATLYDKDIPANDPSYAKSDYSGQASTAVPVPAGIESVTVPKGTYPTAQKYTITTGDGTVSYWIAPGVPVPVQMTMSASGASMTMQLVDYG
jgi:hypothetical protein